MTIISSHIVVFLLLRIALMLVNLSYNNAKIHRLLVQIATNISAGWSLLVMY